MAPFGDVQHCLHRGLQDLSGLQWSWPANLKPTGGAEFARVCKVEWVGSKKCQKGFFF